MKYRVFAGMIVAGYLSLGLVVGCAEGSLSEPDNGENQSTDQNGENTGENNQNNGENGQNNGENDPTEDTGPPVVESFEAEPADWIERNGTADLTVEATEPDGDELSYEYTAPDGWEIDGEGPEVQLSAPDESMAEATIGVTVADSHDNTDTAELEVRTQNTEPAKFGFEDRDVAPSNTEILSNEVEVEGFEGKVRAECTGCEVSVGGGAFGETISGVEAGETVRLRVTSGAAGDTVTSHVTVGDTESEEWSVTAVDWEDVTFTTCDKTGRTGPGQSQCDEAYGGTALAGDVTVVDGDSGIQEWTVPYDGTYRIEARGARGGDAAMAPDSTEDVALGGPGAQIRGDLELQEGDTLRILVGQRGDPTSGGGGTFVVRVVDEGDAMFDDTEVEPLIVAGGGGGAGNPNNDVNNGPAGPGLTTTEGGACPECDVDDDAEDFAEGGVDGEGGNAVLNPDDNREDAGGGGGYFTAGEGPERYPELGGQSFLNGGAGGEHYWDDGWLDGNEIDWEKCGQEGGGFGGGAGCGFPENAGGAGGYSGGGGTWVGGSGGGGSYNAGENQENVEGQNKGAGEVTIELH